ncbi:toll/interleukin-1 receptor domain-containing protein [Actinomadura kijaniata]|uniref:toll/interleukin-1 receptor domain-containing protein n=1 Tax=Actinomadura kijaniata TaxID=46161 RepID=UPI003F1B5725
MAAFSAVFGLAGAYFAYVAVRGRVRRRSSSPPPLPPGRPEADGSYDVYVSYAPADRNWVREFAARLQGQGVRVAYDEVLLRPGDVRVHRLEEAVRESLNGLLVFSRVSMGDGWVADEYALLIERSARTRQRFVPVVIEDVVLPEFAATRYHCDFRGLSPDDARYSEQVAQIARAVRETSS